MNCPSCGGSQTLKTEIAYQNGVQHISGTNASLGVGLIGSNFGVGIMAARDSADVTFNAGVRQTINPYS
jgi:hypothetical protein